MAERAKLEYTIDQWREWTKRCGAVIRGGTGYCMQPIVRRGRCANHAKMEVKS